MVSPAAPTTTKTGNVARLKSAKAESFLLLRSRYPNGNDDNKTPATPSQRWRRLSKIQSPYRADNGDRSRPNVVFPGRERVLWLPHSRVIVLFLSRMTPSRFSSNSSTTLSHVYLFTKALALRPCCSRSVRFLIMSTTLAITSEGPST